MKVPASAIVLPLILAVPFGFAVRDSIKGDDAETKQAAKAKQLAEEETREANARADAEQKQYEREKALVQRRQETVATLIGPNLATFSPVVAAQQMGELPASWEGPRFEHDLDGMFRGGNRVAGIDGTLVDLELELASEACTALHARMTEAWGLGERLGDASTVWADLVHRRRATLIDSTNCTLRFARTVDERAWVDAALPRGIVHGTLAHAKKLYRSIGESDSHVPGLPVGTDSTQVDIQTKDGTVTSMQSSTTATEAEMETIVGLVTKKLGAQPSQVDPATYKWPKAGVVVRLDGDVISLAQDGFYEEP